MRVVRYLVFRVATRDELDATEQRVWRERLTCLVEAQPGAIHHRTHDCPVHREAVWGVFVNGEHQTSTFDRATAEAGLQTAVLMEMCNERG